MSDVIKTIWGQTKLTRTALAVGCLVITGWLLVDGQEVANWFQTLTTTTVLSYFIGRAAETAPGGSG